MTGPTELVTCDQTIEHTIRFAKQTLGWTTPRPRHPAQADRWTWLVLAAYTQLHLARAITGDQRLPWERPQPQPRRSPYRVRRGFPRLLCALGSPAATPKPSGCSPGRPKGRPFWACSPPPGDQEARHQAQEEATHDRRGRLTSPAPSITADLVDGQPGMPTGLLKRTEVAGYSNPA
jgi:hypothetical protein